MPRTSIKKKNPERIMMGLTAAAAAQPSVTLTPAMQSSVLKLLMQQKIHALLTAHLKLNAALAQNPPSPSAILAVIQGIGAEVNLCNMVLASLSNNIPIQFPSQQQMAALSAAVGALGQVVAQGAAIAALIPAVANVIKTFPTQS